jgi:hypothetical protein
MGYKRGVAIILGNLGGLVHRQGDRAAARSLLEESLALWREIGHRYLQCFPLMHLGHVACHEGNQEEATALLREALAISREVGEKRVIVECLERLAEVARTQRQADRASRLLGAAAALRATIGYPVAPYEQEEYAREIATLRAALGEPAFAAAWESGRALTWQEATGYALGRDAAAE